MRTTVAAGSMLVLAAVTACGSPSRVPASDAPATATPSVGMPETAWAALLDSADDPGRLAAGRRSALASLGDVLEGSVVISPTDCLDGLPTEVTDGYVLAIVRPGRDEVRALASELDDEPSFVGAVTVVCSD